MNPTLTILLLVALTINIVCDIVRLWTFCRTVDESKENVKETMCNAIEKAYHDWYWSKHDNGIFYQYFRNNFDKYL